MLALLFTTLLARCVNHLNLLRNGLSLCLLDFCFPYLNDCNAAFWILFVFHYELADLALVLSPSLHLSPFLEAPYPHGNLGKGPHPQTSSRVFFLFNWFRWIRVCSSLHGGIANHLRVWIDVDFQVLSDCSKHLLLLIEVLAWH